MSAVFRFCAFARALTGLRPQWLHPALLSSISVLFLFMCGSEVTVTSIEPPFVSVASRSFGYNHRLSLILSQQERVPGSWSLGDGSRKGSGTQVPSELLSVMVSFKCESNLMSAFAISA